MDSKKCSKCKETKPVEEFYQTKTTKSGYTCSCIACWIKYRKENRDRIVQLQRVRREKYKDLINEQKRNALRLQDPAIRILRQAKSRSKRRGIEFRITQEDFVVPEICPLLECPLFAGVKGDYGQSPSLDRIDPSKGYIPGNVWVTSTKANTMKSNATKEELIVFAKNILKHFEEKEIKV